MKRFVFLLFAVWVLAATAQRNFPPHEYLGRGLVVLPAQGNGKFVSWRFLGTDPQNTTFDVLRDGTVIASNISNATSYTDTAQEATNSSVYQIVTKVGGVIKETTAGVSSWGDIFRSITLDRPGDIYLPNDCSVGDVDGDGEYEIFVKWEPNTAQDNSKAGKTDKVFIDCYKLNGTKLWRVDLGYNIRAGAHYTQFLVYDFNGDGKAELICKTAPGSRDGQNRYVSEAATDGNINGPTANTTSYRNGNGYVLDGPEFLTVFNGQTGAAIHTIYYNPNRGCTLGGAPSGSDQNLWGDNYGNRCDRYLACVAYLDGANRNPSAVMCRGYYTRAYVWAVDFDGSHLRTKWLHGSINSTTVEVTDANGNKTTRTYHSPTSGSGNATLFGNGNHNLSVGDVDGDGCDEVIYGSGAVDNNGQLLYATGFGHGDAIHLGDLMPDRPGLEVFQVHEEKGTYAWDLHDAATGAIIYKGGPSGVDNGRGMAADVIPESRGYEFWSSSDSNPRSTINNNVVSSASPSINFRVYWDGDYQDEILDNKKLEKINGSNISRLITLYNYGGSDDCNYTKHTPCLQADIFGDWREEIIYYDYRDGATINIFTTNIPTEHRVPTLMHDHIYRMGIVWQNVAYNQPPHLGYYLPDIDNLQDQEGTIINPSFETGNLSGWTVEGGIGTRDDIGAKANSGDYAVNGTQGGYIANVWKNDANATCGIYQTVTGLAEGYYTLSALVASDQHNKVTIYAGNSTIDVTATGKTTFLSGTTPKTYVGSDGTLTIGVESHNYFRADAFSLQYLGMDSPPTPDDPEGMTRKTGNWTNATGTYKVNGKLLNERYESATTTTGDAIYQTISGLANGSYTVKLYAEASFTDGRGFTTTASEGQTGVAAVFAKGGTEVYADVPVSYQTAIESGTLDCYTLENVIVNNGTLQIGLTRQQGGTNWQVLGINQLLYNGEASLTSIGLVDQGTVYLYNPASNLYLAAGNAWSTQGTLNEVGLDVTLATSGNGYTIETGVLNTRNGGHHLGSDLYLDNPTPATWFFGETTYNGEVAYTITTDGTNYLAYTGSSVLGTVTDASADVAKWIIMTKQNRIKQLNDANNFHPVNATFLIGDPDFNRSDTRINQWKGNPTKNGTNTNQNGEKYNTTFDVYQTFTGLPNGVYEVSCQGYYRNGGIAEAASARTTGTEALNAMLYANEVTTPLPSIFKEAGKAGNVGDNSTVYGYIPNSQADAGSYFDADLYAGNTIRVTVTNGTLTVGVKKSATVDADWTCFDHFRLTYYGQAVEYVKNGTLQNNLAGEWQTTMTPVQNVQITANASAQVGFDDRAYENWNPTPMTGKMFQTITELPTGTYLLQFSAFANVIGGNEQQYIYANDDEVYLDKESGVYQAYVYVNNGNLEIGVRQDSTIANWICLDNVVLYPVSEEATTDNWQQALSRAQGVLAKASTVYGSITGNELTALQNAVSSYASQPSGNTALQTAIAALNTATNEFVAAKQSYQAYAQVRSLVTTLDTEDLAYASNETREVLQAALADMPQTATQTSVKSAALLQAARNYAESNARMELYRNVDMTSYLNNAIASSTDGWTGSSDFWTMNNESFTDASGKNDYTYLDVNNVNAFTLSQTINNLPKGRYLLSVTARTQSGVETYNLRVTDSQGQQHVAAIPVMGNTGGLFDRGWNDARVPFVQRNDGQATVSIEAANATNFWMSVARFRLYRIDVDGDVNSDGATNTADVVATIQKIFGRTPDVFEQIYGDMDINDIINLSDVTGIVNAMQGR